MTLVGVVDRGGAVRPRTVAAQKASPERARLAPSSAPLVPVTGQTSQRTRLSVVLPRPVRRTLPFQPMILETLQYVEDLQYVEIKHA